MAETLGTAASVIAVLQLSAQVISLSFDYINGVKRAPDELLAFTNEFTNLTIVLKNLETFIQENPEVAALWKLDAQIQKFTKDMRNLKAKLELKKNWLWIPVSRLQWPLHREETLDYIKSFEALKGLFSLAMDNDQVSRIKLVGRNLQRIESNLQGVDTAIQRTETSTQEIRVTQISNKKDEDAFRMAEKRMNVLDWLYPEAFDRRHAEISGRRQEGTGQWILDAPEFQEWRKSPNNMIWGYGIPGAGKTFLSSLVIDDLQDQALAGNYGVAYVYFNYSEKLQQSARDVLSSLVKQLACQVKPGLPKVIEDLYDKLKPQGKKPTLEELYFAFIKVLKLAAFAQAFVICDALDECTPEQRVRILPMLNKMGDDGIKLFLTSREYPEDIQESLKNSLKVKLWAKEEDIASYIERKIEENTRARRLIGRSGCKDKIISELTKCSKGMFLLVHFHIEHVCRQTTSRQVLMELEKISNSSHDERPLDPTYDRAMEILHEQPRSCIDLAMNIFSWLLKAQRVLTVRELQLAVSMKEDQTIFDEDDLPDKKTITDVCASLVTIDRNSDTVRIVHYTAQEYLRNRSIIPENVEIKLAMACATFVSLDIFASACDSNDSLDSRRALYPFLEYVVAYLPDHLIMSGPIATKLIWGFLWKAGNVSSFMQAFETPRPELSYGYDTPTRYNDYTKCMTPLHIAAYIGHCDIAHLLIDKGVDLEAVDSFGRTAIWHAAAHRSVLVACLLLAKGANLVERIRMDGASAISWARMYAESGYEWLLPRKADKKTQNHHGTPSSYELMVQLMSEKGVDFLSKNRLGTTAMHYAASYGNIPVVRLLLEKGTDVLSVDYMGRTPLHYAVEYSHWSVIQLLLEKGADPSPADNEGQTALQLVINKRLESGKGSIQLLLEYGADTSPTDDKGRAAMHLAALWGYVPVVQLLLDSGADPLAVDNQGKTAMHLAARWGQDSVVQLLLENGADPSLTDNEGQTAMDLAKVWRDDRLAQYEGDLS